MGAFKEKTNIINGLITCNKCGESKDLRFYSKIKENNSYRNTCTQCRSNSKTSRFKQQDIVLSLHLQGLKECITCKILKDLTEFHKNKNTRFGLSSNCKSCSLDHRINYKDRLLYRKYSLEVGGFNIMLEKQRNKCLICENVFGNSSGTKAVVDHCHNNGIVRGLLCGQCNKGIGTFKDDTNILYNAIIYLQKYQDDSTIEYCI